MIININQNTHFVVFKKIIVIIIEYGGSLKKLQIYTSKHT